MVLAIVRKELRETWAFAALALGLYLIYLSPLMKNATPLLASLVTWLPGMGSGLPEVPFVRDGILTNFFLIGVALAIALGIRQSAWEPSQGTALYLLHLPLARRALFLTKLTTGVSLLLASTLLPILTYASWAALPRTHPSPFEWSMTGGAFRLWLLLPVVYLGAFASGIRPANWFGSRLWPLFAVAVPAIFAYATPHWWLIGLPIVLLAAGVLVCDILRESDTRDY